MADSTNCTADISLFSSVFLGIFNGLSGLAAIIGNLIVLVTFFKNQSLRQPSYYLLASLASMDLLVGFVANPLYIVLTNFVTWQYREENLLQLESFFAMTSSMIIMHTLTCMSVERYIAVNYSLRYHNLVTEKRTWVTVTIVWIFGFSLNALYFVTSNDDLPKMWITCGAITGIVPMIVIFSCYGKILLAARKQARRIAVTERCTSNSATQDGEENTPASGQKRTMREAKRACKAARNVGIAIAVVMLLSMPVSVVSIIQIVTAGDICRFRYNNQVWMWVATLSLLSSALDPWIYAMRIQEFKDCFKRTMRIN